MSFAEYYEKLEWQKQFKIKNFIIEFSRPCKSAYILGALFDSDASVYFGLIFYAFRFRLAIYLLKDF